MRRPALLVMVIIAGIVVAFSIRWLGRTDRRAEAAPAPTTERVLLGAPDPTGPMTRGVFLRDPEGQVEHIAAGDGLVAWTVRSPADPLSPVGDPNRQQDRPYRFPQSTRVVVVDERGGAPLVVDLGRRFVSDFAFTHGSRGAAEPRFVVETCGAPGKADCRIDVLEVTPRSPVTLIRRLTGEQARVAARSDLGRTLVVRDIPKGANDKLARCLPRLEIRDDRAERPTILPAIPEVDEDAFFYPRCKGFHDASLAGDVVLASVDRDNPKESFEGRVVFGLDLTLGARARWVAIKTPYRYSDGSTGYAFGPAVSSTALIWEETDGEGGTYSVDRVRLPGDLRRTPSAKAPVAADPIALGTYNACDIAATEGAIYELANPRCAWDSYSTGRGAGEIRRIVNPLWYPEPTE